MIGVARGDFASPLLPPASFQLLQGETHNSIGSYNCTPTALILLAVQDLFPLLPWTPRALLIPPAALSTTLHSSPTGYCGNTGQQIFRMESMGSTHFAHS